MEQLIIKAIREFKKQHSDAEIRVVYVTESNGGFKKIQSATFCIEYVTEPSIGFAKTATKATSTFQSCTTTTAARKSCSIPTTFCP